MKDLEAHNEVLSGMKAVSRRLHYSGVRIGKELGAIAFSGNVSSGWMRFLMPDNKVVFGTISSVSEKSDVIADVSDIHVFNGVCEKLGFQHAEEKWRKYFSVPEYESEENISKYEKI